MSKKTNHYCDNEYSRNFCINTYLSVNELEMFLRSRDWISHWCYTTHDKDKTEDGTTKEKHTHVLLYTYSAKTSSAVKKNFDRYSKEITKDGDEPQNTLVQICHDMVSQYRYQLHLDDPDKYQYSVHDRYCDDVRWWSKLENTDGMSDVKNTALQIFNDMLEGATVVELTERYGKDFVYHYAHYQKVLAQHFREQYLAEKSDMRVEEYFEILLEGAPFSPSDISQFFIILSYLKQECIVTYNSKLDFYLTERNT